MCAARVDSGTCGEETSRDFHSILSNTKDEERVPVVESPLLSSYLYPYLYYSCFLRAAQQASLMLHGKIQS